ncbi:MAG: hypothetical protein IJ048_08370 [Clostridia bacterium]|nr:hypothetical protein [Clostridia bacterium]
MTENNSALQQEEQAEESPRKTSQVANMDFSDFMDLLMESRIIQPQA